MWIIWDAGVRDALVEKGKGNNISNNEFLFTKRSSPPCHPRHRSISKLKIYILRCDYLLLVPCFINFYCERGLLSISVAHLLAHFTCFKYVGFRFPLPPLLLLLLLLFWPFKRTASTFRQHYSVLFRLRNVKLCVLIRILGYLFDSGFWHPRRRHS